MEKQNLERERSGAKSTKSQGNQLEWGDHNKKLTDLNFIDRQPKVLAKQKDLMSSTKQSVDLSNEEPSRSREGVKKTTNKLDS